MICRPGVIDIIVRLASCHDPKMYQLSSKTISHSWSALVEETDDADFH